MALKKGPMNIIFAVIVFGLVSTAVVSMILRERSVPAPAAATGSANTSLPENHPPADRAERLAALLQKSADEPRNAEVQAEIGNVYFDLGQYDKAADSYRKSLQLLPRNPNVETDLATCLHNLRRDDEAIEVLDRVLGYQPDFPPALYNKGIVLIHGKNDIEGGIAAWEALLATNLDPARRQEIEQSIRQLKASAR